MNLALKSTSKSLFTMIISNLFVLSYASQSPKIICWYLVLRNWIFFLNLHAFYLLVTFGLRHWLWYRPESVRHSPISLCFCWPHLLVKIFSSMLGWPGIGLLNVIEIYQRLVLARTGSRQMTVHMILFVIFIGEQPLGKGLIMATSVLTLLFVACTATIIASVFDSDGHSIVKIVVIGRWFWFCAFDLLALRQAIIAILDIRLQNLELFLEVLPLVNLSANDACVSLHSQPATLDVISVLWVETAEISLSSTTNSAELVAKAILADSILVHWHVCALSRSIVHSFT